MAFFDKSIDAQYDAKALKKYALLAAFVPVLMFLTKGYFALLMPILAIGALCRKNPVQLMFWVMFMTFFAVGNRAVFNGNLITLMVVRVTLALMTAAVAVKAFDGRISRANSLFWGITPYLIWEAFISLQGYQPVVSYLKLALFATMFLAMFGIANTVNASPRTEARVLRSAILSLVALVLVGSILLIPLPSLSLMAVDEGVVEKMLSGELVSLFCGMCAHSQALGPAAAILGTFLFADLVFSIKKWDKFYLLMIACAFVCIYKTSSRTAMGTFISGIVFVSWLVIRSRGMGAKWKTRVSTVMTILLISCSIVVMMSPNVRNGIVNFAMKWNTSETGKAEVNVENLFSSRQMLIDRAVYNFKQKPYIGNGFQVSEEMRYEKRNGILSYVSAPIEKGVWIYAVLEEGGVVGMMLFCGWLLILIPLLVKRHAYVMASTFFAFLVSNFGEFSLFAMSYIGGFFWTVVFAAGCLDVLRMKNQGLRIWMPYDPSMGFQ